MNLCRSKNPNIKFVYGGAEAKYKHSYGIDCFFTNNNNDSDIIDYLTKIIHNDGNLPNEYNITNKTDFDFNSSQILWHESDHIFQNEVLPIEIARGCIFNCSYCNLSIRGKKKTDNIKNYHILIEEFNHNYDLYKTTSYFFCDSTLNDSTQKLEYLIDNVISKLNFKLEFSSYLRLDLINAHREQIKLLKDMGLKFAVFGIGSLNEESLKSIRKTFPRDKMEKIMQILKDEWKDDVIITGSFIYGLPYETQETLNILEKWLLEESLNYFHYVDVNPLRLSLNDQVNKNLKSEIALNLEKYNYRKDKTENVKNFNWISNSANIDYLTANKKCEEIMFKLHNDNRCKFANINAIGYYNSGLSFDKIKTSTYLDIKNDPSMINNYFEKIQKYKNNLLI
jgi:radical SAM superfamily enzyme YgiQ (UPF0313 family)